MNVQILTHRFHLSEKSRKRLLAAIKEKCENIETAIQNLTLYVNTVVQKKGTRVIQCSLTLRSTNGQIVHVESRGPSLRSTFSDAMRRVKNRLCQKLKRWRSASKRNAVLVDV